MTLKEAYTKAARFCAYQERTQQQVRDKLYEWGGLRTDDIEGTIARLISDNFINEERFAKAFASGKFRQNKWGRIKIKQGLKQLGLSDYCIKQGMKEIDGDNYEKLAKKLVAQKNSAITDKNPLVRRQKILRFMMGKGFEADIVSDILSSPGETF